MSGSLNRAPRDHELVLTTEEAALRHVALLVARGAPTAQIFEAAAQQVALVLGRPWVGIMRYDSAESFLVVATWGEHPFPVGSRWPLDGRSTFEVVLRTGRPAAVTDYTSLSGTVAEAAREAGIVGGVGAPIVVDGTTWGVIAVPATQAAPIPPGAETRLSVFTELVATAISNAKARAMVTRLVDEQEGLRRVATLVAHESSPVDVFVAVSEEARRVMVCEAAGLLRFEPDGTATLVAQSETPWDPPPLGTRFTLDGENLVTHVFQTRRAVRVDDWARSTGAVAAMATVLGVRSAVAAPVVVEERLWGTIIVSTGQDEPLPADTELRLAQFTELVATAIANADARDARALLAQEQAALRRVATLVADGIGPEGVFPAVAAEVDALFGADVSAIVRFERDRVVTVLGDVGGPHMSGKRVTLDPGYVVDRVRTTRRSARFDTEDPTAADMPSLVRAIGIRSAVASPIVVEGELWGAITAASVERPLAADAERHLSEFTELLATAVSNTQAREQVAALAREQAALRRVATQVARRDAPEVVFERVAAEAGDLLHADIAALVRFEEDDTVTVIAGPPPGPFATGTRVALDPAFVVHQVRETGRPARFETDDPAGEGMPEVVRRLHVRSTLASPILVEGALWGAIVLGSRSASFPPATERRLDDFTELVATAISNASARAELIASRARIVAAGDEARRRIERNLHDGTQQRLIALGFDLRRIQAAIAEDDRDAHAALMRAEEDLDAILGDLRELSHGLHPPMLSRAGLGPSLQALARRSPIPVELTIDLPERPAASLETAVYYVVSEALTNAVKHSQASNVSVAISSDGCLRASIVDDGVGGADPGAGSGLTGLRDRIDTLGGSFALDSPEDGGTRISIELPDGAAIHLSS